MNNLINLQTTNEGVAVSAKELHSKLEVAERFSKWFERMKNYGFQEGTDFNLYQTVQVQKEGNRDVHRSISDYALTLDTAKQICMLQRSEKGRIFREYFIQVEKDWNSPEKVMARALSIANHTIDTLNQQVIEMHPKAVFADAVAVSDDGILVGALAKLLKQNGVDTGQKRLFEWLRANGYLIKDGRDKNIPTQRAMEKKLFKVKERTITNPDGSSRITRTCLVTGKGQQYFINKFLDNPVKGEQE